MSDYDDEVNKDASLGMEKKEELEESFKEIIEDDDDEILSSELEEMQSMYQKSIQKDVIQLSDIEVLEIKNCNLQILLADKTKENLELKQSLLLKEKQEVINRLADIKRAIGQRQDININNYVFDIANKRIVNKILTSSVNKK